MSETGSSGEHGYRILHGSCSQTGLGQVGSNAQPLVRWCGHTILALTLLTLMAGKKNWGAQIQTQTRVCGRS